MANEALNTLFILSDEHDPRVMGAAGHALAQTPNLDRLAARGVRFTNAYTPSPVCVPARASLATGRWVHDIGYWDNATGYDGRVPGWGHRLLAAGHRVESIGKLHYRNGADPTGFGAQHEPLHLMDGVGQVWGSVRDPMPETIGRSPLFDKIGPGESPYNRYDERIAACAAQWLEERSRAPDAKPWTLFVGLVAPHFPLVVPQTFFDLYPLDRIPLPKLLPRDGYRRHPWVERNARHCDHDAAFADDDHRRLAIACYLGLVSFMDHQVGRILDALEKCGLCASTRILYSSDHGDNLGARGMWNKCLLYRESTAVPMIVSGPGLPSGEVRSTNVNLVDIGPTLLQGAGLPPEADLPGRSLFELAREPDDPQRIGFSEYHAVGAATGGFALARGGFKFHYYVDYPPELFDLASDPEEARDLAGDPAYRQVREEMERALRAMLDPEAVDRRAKDDQNALVEKFGGRERALHIGPPGATPAPGN